MELALSLLKISYDDGNHIFRQILFILFQLTAGSDSEDDKKPEIKGKLVEYPNNLNQKGKVIFDLIQLLLLWKINIRAYNLNSV